MGTAPRGQRRRVLDGGLARHSERVPPRETDALLFEIRQAVYGQPLSGRADPGRRSLKAGSPAARQRACPVQGYRERRVEVPQYRREIRKLRRAEGRDGASLEQRAWQVEHEAGELDGRSAL